MATRKDKQQIAEMQTNPQKLQVRASSSQGTRIDLRGMSQNLPSHSNHSVPLHEMQRTIPNEFELEAWNYYPSLPVHSKKRQRDSSPPPTSFHQMPHHDFYDDNSPNRQNFILPDEEYLSQSAPTHYPNSPFLNSRFSQFPSPPEMPSGCYDNSLTTIRAISSFIAQMSYMIEAGRTHLDRNVFSQLNQSTVMLLHEVSSMQTCFGSRSPSPSHTSPPPEDVPPLLMPSATSSRTATSPILAPTPILIGNNNPPNPKSNPPPPPHHGNPPSSLPLTSSNSVPPSSQASSSPQKNRANKRPKLENAESVNSVDSQVENSENASQPKSKNDSENSAYSREKKRMQRINRINRTLAQNPNLRCEFCQTRDTPEWRKGPQGKNTLCNACGIRYSKEKRQQMQKNPSKSD